MLSKELSKEKMIDILRAMYRIRFLDEKVNELYDFHGGLISGAVHNYTGQEATAVGACAVIEKRDYVIGTHRCRGQYIAKGGDLRRLMAELMGKETGCCKGRGGDMHPFDVNVGFMGGSAIVGGNIPIAVGMAFSAKYRISGQVTLCFFGDGASNQGTFHESLNLAARWNLPVIFICENNMYAATTSVKETFPVPDIAVRACAYGMPGKVVDGNDVFKVYEVVSEAVAKARTDEGPTLIESKTYRMCPHSGIGQDGRPEEELKEWRAKDPIPRFEKELLKARVMTSGEIEKMRMEVREEVEEAESFARNSPYPDSRVFRESCEE
jgi:TPP-dependent pyruvate/acetoin dehydrogenase alpha subunit